ncbi:hypothetical protein U6G28_07725 [Actinomycetaceae bacterium MB13-C1-2]|nr:hypothetical protein U6G28_07725 [Actinomycetaceae bacterium MB13-C1-2]
MSPKETLPAPPQDPGATAKAKRAQTLTNSALGCFVILATLLVLSFTLDTSEVLRAVAAIGTLLSGLLLMLAIMLTMSLKAERKRAQKTKETATAETTS